MRPAIAAAFLLLVTGCGTLEGPRTGTISPPADALARWNDFPADRVPRPIVLLVNHNPNPLGAFDSGAGKLGYYCSKFSLGFLPTSEVPKQATITWADGTATGYGATSATDAFNAMRAAPAEASPADCASVPPLVLSGVRLGTSGYGTDRGTIQMSSWLFTATGLHGEIAHPAVSQSNFWPGPILGTIGGGATVSSSGRDITFSFPGGPTEGTCAVNYAGVVAESTHAVAVAVQSSPGRVEAGPVSCDALGYDRFVTVTLASPLGGRVVVDASGAPIPVCPEASRSAC
jgi:hypothetical protein